MTELPLVLQNGQIMKVTIRINGDVLSAYIPKKDLEEPIISVEDEALWGGSILLRNGWRLALPHLPQEARLPVTVEARRMSGRLNRGAHEKPDRMTRIGEISSSQNAAAMLAENQKMHPWPALREPLTRMSPHVSLPENYPDRDWALSMRSSGAWRNGSAAVMWSRQVAAQPP